MPGSDKALGKTPELWAVVKSFVRLSLSSSFVCGIVMNNLDCLHHMLLWNRSSKMWLVIASMFFMVPRDAQKVMGDVLAFGSGGYRKKSGGNQIKIPAQKGLQHGCFQGIFVMAYHSTLSRRWGRRFKTPIR